MSETKTRPLQFGASLNLQGEDVESAALRDAVSGPLTTPTTQAKPEKKEEKKEEEVTELKLTPAERWEKNLAAAGLNEAQAFVILDDVIAKGYWEKEYVLFRGRLNVTFRTRDGQHRRRVQRALQEQSTPVSTLSFTEIVTRYNLAASLSVFKKNRMPFAPENGSVDQIEEAFLQRYDFVGKISGPVFDQLVEALIDFDKIVAAAFSEGAASGF